MKNLLTWAKDNVIVLVCAMVCLLSLGFLALVHMQGRGFASTMEEEAVKEVAKIDGLMNASVRLPSKTPGGPPDSKTVAPSKAVINDLTVIFAQMKGEHQGLLNYVVEMNRLNHIPIMEGLFPVSDYQRAWESMRYYLQAFREMFEPYSSNAIYPHLDAKPPLSPEEVQRQLDAWVRDNPPPTSSGAEAERYEAERTRKLWEIHLRHARSIHLYVDSENHNEPWDNQYPFEVGSWSRREGRTQPPTPQEMWEGQEGLWIQMDIARAIALTNQVHIPDANVTNMPVKRLIRISLVPGYVGMNKDAVNFILGPSGRQSNELYDVRHARIEMVIDSQRMPEFFDNLAQVNFISVLKADVRHVDPYEDLNKGYVYGSNSVVNLTLVVETLWMRSWTTKLMPPVVLDPKTRMMSAGAIRPEAIGGVTGGGAMPGGRFGGPMMGRPMGMPGAGEAGDDR